MGVAKRFADSGTSAVAVATFMGERVCVCVGGREGREQEEMREGEELGDRVRWRERV